MVTKRGVWWQSARGLFYPIGWLSGSRQFLGREHIPADGPALVVANHISYIDPIYTAVYVDSTGRLPHFLAKDAVFRMPVVGLLARKLEQIPVHRGSSEAVDSLSAAGEALADGHVVVVYPEGTITRDPQFWPMRARTGAARLALEHDVPVIPVAHWNTQRIYDHYGGKKFRPLPRKTAVVAAGEPVDLSSFRAAQHENGQERGGELLRQVTDHLMVAVRDVLVDLRGEEAPADFYQPARRERE